jgi:hypothetical protein
VEPTTHPQGIPEPATVLGTGSVDAAVLSVLWLIRRSVWTLLWAGVIVFVLSGDLGGADDLETPTITSAADAREVVGSPRVLLLLAPVARLGSGWVALLAAYPLARRFQRHADREARRTGRHPVVWSDRWYLVRALRDWRWTSSVRRLARQRLGRAGPPILVLDIALLVTGIVLLPVALTVLVRSLA